MDLPSSTQPHGNKENLPLFSPSPLVSPSVVAGSKKRKTWKRWRVPLADITNKLYPDATRMTSSVLHLSANSDEVSPLYSTVPAGPPRKRKADGVDVVVGQQSLRKEFR